MLNETVNNIPVEQETEDNDTIIYTAGSNGKPLLASIKKEFNLNQVIRKFYRQDKIHSKILENPKAHAIFGVKEGLIFTKDNLSRDVICVSPKAMHKGKRLIKIIIDHAHNIIGYFRQFKTSQYIRRYFWCSSLITGICHDQGCIYQPTPCSRVSNNLHNKLCGIYWMRMIQS